MKTKILLLAGLFFSIKGYNQTWQWTHPEPNGIAVTRNSYTDASEVDDAHDVETDASGNVYVLGDFMDSLYLNNIVRTRGDGSYLAKYDSTGKLLWYKLIVPTYTPDYYYSGSIRATDLTVNAQGVFITGRYYPSGFQNGSYSCSTGMGSGQLSYSIGNTSFTAGFNEIGFFLTKFTASGSVAWNKLGTAQSCFNGTYISPYGISYNPLITSDKSNNVICEFMYGGNQANLINIGSDIPVPPPTNNNAFIMFKMNSAGTLQWSNYAANTKYTSASHDCNSMVTDKNGNTFIYGLTSDSCQFGSIYYRTHYRESEQGIVPYSTFIAKISSSGIWQFANELCNNSQNYLEGGIGNPDYLATDISNNIYALVNTAGNSIVITGDSVPTDKTHTYLVKLTNAGALVYHKGFGSDDTKANSVQVANNFLYITGSIRNFTYLGHPWYFSNLTVKPTSPDNGGPVEYYVSKANTNGDFQWVTSFSSPDGFMEGNAVKVFNDNIYTAGYYSVGISTLGNLNGTYYNPNSGTHNLFFGKLKDQYIRVGQLHQQHFARAATSLFHLLLTV